MSTFMPSRRIERTEDFAFHDMEVGTYCKNEDGSWWLMPPADGPLRLAEGDGWGLIEHEDGTLEIGPEKPGDAHSIWINKPHGWHGFLRRGQWETV